MIYTSQALSKKLQVGIVIIPNLTNEETESQSD